MKQLLDEARRLIRINSVSSNGDEELANYVAELLQDRGLKTQLQQVTHSLEGVSKRQFNVIGILGDPLVDKKTRKGLLLSTHMDTTSPGIPENWTETGGDPYAGTVKDGKIYGLGAAAAKLDLLCKLQAIEKFRERKLKMPIYLVGTCGAELGMFGVRYLVKSLALNPKYVVVGEPSDMKVVVAHKCLTVVRVSIDYQLVERDARGFNRRIDLHSFGKSSHGAYPHLGNNAILQALDFLQVAADNGFEIRYTHVEGGETKNTVPDRARAEFYLTSHQFEDFKRFFRESVKAQGKEKAFRVELGGLGDMGVRFLPEALFSCVMELIRFFRDLSTRYEARKDPAYEPPYSTVNFGQLRQRPSGVDLYFDLCFLPEQSAEEEERSVTQGIQAIAARYPSLNLMVSRERLNPSFTAGEGSALSQICTEALGASSIKPEFLKKSTPTETAQYVQAGFESVALGPGSPIGSSHGPNEFNTVEQLEKAVVFYQRLIEKVCL